MIRKAVATTRPRLLGPLPRSLPLRPSLSGLTPLGVLLLAPAVEYGGRPADRGGHRPVKGFRPPRACPGPL
ncbi:hypothetical protein GCM10010129_67900 [Streptomyces fumigatiscleroticus]|nr:hypothetical protein GCM10010129_67900 [Streptomyces fumigatiscleroticus]